MLGILGDMCTKKVTDHPTQMVVIKKAPVDILMIPLVRWLNSFETITTQFCCQGEPATVDPETNEFAIDDTNKPYVLFFCINIVDLITILNLFKYEAITEIYWNEAKNIIEYCARFHDQQSLLRVIDRIGFGIQPSF